KRGDKIGEMGDTGRATATHVHYTVIRNNRAVQPFDYIFDEKNRSSTY
ncbi:MAG: M23 family metallopeptidase, partial [Candidatus Latescibacteria bacterium]|nr:M23 family metallopeptidase [Candidatus Latescibacterota bacterium]